jgi:UDP-N-acetylmuramyl pentapeptide synthase
VIAVGESAAGIAEGAGHGAHRVGSLLEAAAAVRELAARDAVVVVKASRVAGLERLVEALRTKSQVG